MLLNRFIVIARIHVNPSNATVLLDQPSELTCNAVGTNISYQWMKNNTLVRGANSNTLRINSAMESDEGVYKCVASNRGGRDESDPATVTVYGK